MTAPEFNELFDDAIKQIKDAKQHWMVNPMASLMELIIAKTDIEKIIKIIAP